MQQPWVLILDLSSLSSLVPLFSCVDAACSVLVPWPLRVMMPLMMVAPPIEGEVRRWKEGPPRKERVIVCVYVRGVKYCCNSELLKVDTLKMLLGT